MSVAESELEMMMAASGIEEEHFQFHGFAATGLLTANRSWPLCRRVRHVTVSGLLTKVIMTLSQSDDMIFLLRSQIDFSACKYTIRIRDERQKERVIANSLITMATPARTVCITPCSIPGFLQTNKNPRPYIPTSSAPSPAGPRIVFGQRPSSKMSSPSDSKANSQLGPAQVRRLSS